MGFYIVMLLVIGCRLPLERGITPSYESVPLAEYNSWRETQCYLEECVLILKGYLGGTPQQELHYFFSKVRIQEICKYQILFKIFPRKKYTGNPYGRSLSLSLFHNPKETEAYPPLNNSSTSIHFILKII